MCAFTRIQYALVTGTTLGRPNELFKETEISVRADGIIKSETKTEVARIFKVKRFSKTLSRLLYNSLHGSVFHFFKIVNQKARFEISLWHMNSETSEHVRLLTKVFKLIVFPASLLYVCADFYFFGQNALDSMFLGILIFFYSNFLPDLPSVYYRKKKYGGKTEDLLWDEKFALLVFAPLFVGAFLCGMRLRWHTSETFHNFKSLTTYTAFLLLFALFAYCGIGLPPSIGYLTKILSLPSYGMIGYLTHLKVDKIW